MSPAPGRSTCPLIAWADVPRHPVPPDAIRHSVTCRTSRATRSSTSGRSWRPAPIDDPEVATFLACWLYEETFHGIALARFLEAAGHPVVAARRPRGQEPSRSARGRRCRPGLPRLARLLRVHMTWGAINELTTLTGYRRLAAVAGTPCCPSCSTASRSTSRATSSSTIARPRSGSAGPASRRSRAGSSTGSGPRWAAACSRRRSAIPRRVSLQRRRGTRRGPARSTRPSGGCRDLRPRGCSSTGSTGTRPAPASRPRREEAQWLRPP